MCRWRRTTVLPGLYCLRQNIPEKIAEIVKGVAEGCVQSEAALIGGETAEHPGLMPEDEYDLAGFAVGVVDKKDLLTGESLKPGGSVLIGIASTGVHSNGFSLVRKVFDMTRNLWIPIMRSLVQHLARL